MPRKTNADVAKPRRRRAAAAAVAVAVESERGLALRVLLHSPKDTAAGMLAFAATCAIIVNALLLQNGPHPAPMFGPVVALPAALASTNPIPRPRPAEADVTPSEAKATEPRAPEQKAAEPRAGDPLANLVRSTSSIPSTNIVRPPAPVPLPTGPASRRVAAVQRALTDYGYGQLKPTGTMGADTQAAIQRFEHDRRLPVTGQVSERLVRELSAVIGHPVE